MPISAVLSTMFEFDVPSRLLRDVRRFDRDDLLVKLAGFSLDPAFQDNHLRVFTLVQLTIARAVGRKRATVKDLTAMLNMLLDHDSGRKEDPSEDVFSGTVTHPDLGDLRIFFGNFPGSDFHLQRMLDAFVQSHIATRNNLSPCLALLQLSEAIAARCGTEPIAFKSGEIYRENWLSGLPALVALGRQSCFSNTDLVELAIDPASLARFILTEPEALLDLSCGENEIMARPLVQTTFGLCLPVPSLVSPAIRLFLTQEMQCNYEIAREIKEHLYTALWGRWLVYDFPRRSHIPIDNETLMLDAPSFEMFGDYAHSILRFDEDKAAHLIWLGPDWSDPPTYALHKTFNEPPNFTLNFNRYIEKCIDQIKTQFNRGLTIVVYDSPGWNVDFSVNIQRRDDWYIVGLPSHALALLLSDPTFDLIALWKMERQLHLLSEHSIVVSLYPDLINFWAFWQELGGTFRPPGIDLEAFGGISADTSAILPWVAGVRAFRGTHGAQAGNGTWERVERRLNPRAAPEELIKPIFFQPRAIVLSTMRYVIEGNGSWWVSTARPPFSREDSQFLFLLWQTASEWMLLLQTHPLNPLSGRLPCFELGLFPVPDLIVDAPQQFERQSIEDFPAVVLVIPPKFMKEMATPDNKGEANLVDEIALSAISASGVEVSEADRRAWVDAVTADPALKMMHVTLSADKGVAVDLVTQLPSFRPLSKVDLTDTGFSARALVSQDQIHEQCVITDPNTIKTLLSKIVDARWQRCRALLSTLDRSQVIILVYRQIEALLHERAEDARGALARTRFYVASQDSGWMLGRISNRDAAYRCYRVIAEMAVCECPLVGGRIPGLTDIDEISAEIFHLISSAEYSDAVKYKLVPGQLEFLPDGSLDTGEDGAQIAMPEYLRASLQEIVDVDVESYPEHFIAEFGSDSDSEDTFFGAYENEFGIPVFDAVQISLALQSICVERQAHVIDLRRSEVLASAAFIEASIDDNQLDLFLQAFGLATRPAWDVPPKSFNGADIWPWLFERRLSLMVRPVLIVDTSDDPLLIYGVRHLEFSGQYSAHLLEDAIWSRELLRSDIAKSFYDTVVAKRGDDFEAEIVNLARAAGWHVIPKLQMRRLGAPKGLGEIDALAVHHATGIWMVIECKWCGHARTAREVMNWMQGFHGKGGDKLDHHLQRVTWIKNNLEKSAKQLSLALPTRVIGQIVSTQPVPLAFAQTVTADVGTLTKRQFVEALCTLAGDAK